MSKKLLITLALISGIISFWGCNEFSGINSQLAPEVDLLSGGNTTVFDQSPTAFSQANPALKGKEELDFFVGDSFFNQNWVAAPASAKSRDGLGPLFNARSCSSCHLKDGKGMPLLTNQEESHGFLMRISIPGEASSGAPLAHSFFGGQWQDQSVDPALDEGGIEVYFTYRKVFYEDGDFVELRVPHYKIIDKENREIKDLLMSPRVGQHLVGMGLIEAIEEQTILQYVDDALAKKWNVSGKANRVFDEKTKAIVLGRFGWKAGQPSVAQQVAAAFNGDMGITSSLYPSDNMTAPQRSMNRLPDGGTPELEDDDFEKIVLYTSNLAVPARRNVNDKRVQNGSQLFTQIGCDACHRRKMTTGKHPIFDALSNQTIYPYSDFLLHDMGADLADHRSEFLANGQEWRTPPLWGIGLVETVNNHTYFLHDGRARNLEEAILWHGGEAQNSIAKFKSLNAAERSAIIAFLRSL